MGLAMIELLENYGVLFFGAIGIVLCIGLQVVDFINYMSGDSEDE